MSLDDELISAVKRGDKNEVESLLDGGANPNAPDSDNHTPLFCATIYGLHGNNIEIIELLLKHDAITNNSTGFHLIALAPSFKINNLLEIIKLFKKYNVDINTKDDTDHTALHLAIETNTIKKIVKIEVVIALINAGANIELTNKEGLTPLHIAAKSGHEKVVEILIEHGADLNIQDNFNCTPLHWAAQHGHTEVIRFLIEHNATIDAKDNSGTPLYWAAFHNHIKTFFLLLLYGSDVSAKDRQEIKEKPKLVSCLAEFEQIKAMPHLGKLIEANTKWDEEENAKAIASYINNEAEGQKLIKEFKTIKEKYGSNEQLSFVPEHLLDFIEHITIKFLKSRINQKTIADQLHRSKDDIQVTKKFTEGVQNIYENLSKIASEKIVSYFDNDTKKNVLLALNKKADEFLNKLKNVCQSPNTALASSQSKEIEPSAEHKRIDR